MAHSAPKSIAVLGAGITGLTAAHRLHQLGHGVRIFEQSDRCGGAIRTERTDGWLIESGPNSLLGGETALETLISELGLADQRLPASPAARNRYIARGDRLIPAPLTPAALLRSSLFSASAKLQIAIEFLSRRRIRTSDVSLAEFVGAHFGREFVDYALDPFVSGVYAGDVRKLSSRHAFPTLWELEQTHGSLLRGHLARAKARAAARRTAPAIFSFRNGLQTLPEALAARLPAGALTPAVSLDAIVPGEKWSVIWHDATATHTQSFDKIVVALPGPALAQLRIGALSERPLAALAAMEHPPVSSLFLGYRRDQIAHPLDGFGALIPSAEHRSALGVLFSSTLFPGRAPDGHIALTVMIGGSRQSGLASLPTEQLITAVQPDLAALLGASGEPVFVRRQLWPRAIPQYQLGHEQFLSAIAAAEHRHRSLFVGGPVRDGISVPACIAAGEKLAARAAA